MIKGAHAILYSDDAEATRATCWPTAQGSQLVRGGSGTSTGVRDIRL
jgi:hypothetical protein